MPQIRRDSLMSLETYSRERAAFRSQVLVHKKFRTLPLGDHVTLVFEDELTIRYQVQEMLRIERIFEDEGVADELAAYNPLIPDGSNFKATMLIEFPDPEERKRWLSRLIGVEDRVWIQVDGCPRVMAIADEDLERENDAKTSSVHFLRFELDPAMKTALKQGAALGVGVDHPAYTAAVSPVAAELRGALIEDLD
jgi:hypothetical protein